MENTTPKKLREKLKDYLDLAKKEKIRIKRRSGQNYILMTEEKYTELKNAVTSLQKRLLGKGLPAVKEKEKKVAKKIAKTK
jgi:PHD/YefM family antitoxin component YafN of YafNO toxin-antitoxin module